MKNFNNYANSFQAIARLRLESIRCLMDFLGNPQENLKFIHVAGTNGKGSVCEFLRQMISASGLKCGKYISPNLISPCERISVDGIEILETEMNNLLSRVHTECLKVEELHGEMPTQFEIWTACAFLYFAEKNCDMVILETGLGGTRDATNIIPPPFLSVITRIDLDHTEYLGDTIEAVAREKCGIIKGSTVVTIPQNPLSVIKEYSDNVIVAETPKVNPDLTFDYKDFKNLHSGLKGINQFENASLAIECALYAGLNESQIRQGLEMAKNPARFEILAPDLVYDGAHNKNGMESLTENLKLYFPDKKPGFVMASMKEKDHNEIFNLIPKGVKIYAVAVKDNPRSLSAEELSDKARAYGIQSEAFDKLKDAISACRKENELTVICGSLYLYKDFDEIRENFIPENY